MHHCHWRVSGRRAPGRERATSEAEEVVTRQGLLRSPTPAPGSNPSPRCPRLHNRVVFRPARVMQLRSEKRANLKMYFFRQQELGGDGEGNSHKYTNYKEVQKNRQC
mmetsp:Transcript_33617/g.100228  ORF Transcript_33617/g.100228 Transcript_33617/m.100228 type:complete len:107 (+) Transcript_33617:1148-1468(+)